MRVLHVIPSLSLAHGGPTRALAVMERALNARGVSVETLTTDDDGPGRRKPRPGGRPALENGARRWYFGRWVEFYKVAPTMIPWLVAHVRSYDLLHIHALFSFSSTCAAWIARLMRVPYVIRPLGTLDRYGVTRRRPWLKSLSLRLVEGPILKNAAAVHFTSEAEAAHARELGVSMRGVVIPLGIAFLSERENAHQSGHPNRRGARLLFMSRLDPKKNLEGLLAAVAIAASRAPQLHLVVAGAGDPIYAEGLRRFAGSLGVSDRVTWLGHVDGAAKADALAGADLFVLPSFSENFGIAVAEALCECLPCLLAPGVAIAADVVAARAGISVEPTPEAIAEAIVALLADPESLARMSENAGRLAFSRYSADAMGERLEQLYERILGQ